MTNKANTNNKSVKNVIVPDYLELNKENRVEFSSKEFSQYIHALLQNWRQGTVGVKGRSDVSFSNKKPWKQKGTGRARAGSARSPIWRKGGVTFGPQPRVRTLQVCKKLKNRVLRALLWKYLENQNVFSLNWVPGETPKTALAFQALKSAELHDKKLVLFVSRDDLVAHSSFANISNVNMLLYDQPNAYDLSNSDYWVFLDKDINEFKEMVSKWI